MSRPVKAAFSVTQSPDSYCGCKSLPTDLNAVLNLAVYSASSAGSVPQIVESAIESREGKARGLLCEAFVGAIEGITREYPYHHLLWDVAVELNAVSEPNARFDSACAHEAALEFATKMVDAVWWAGDQTGYLRVKADESLRKNFNMDVREVANHLDLVHAKLCSQQWPDANAIVTACKIEAAKAASLRQQNGSPRLRTWKHPRTAMKRKATALFIKLTKTLPNKEARTKVNEELGTDYPLDTLESYAKQHRRGMK